MNLYPCQISMISSVLTSECVNIMIKCRKFEWDWFNSFSATPSGQRPPLGTKHPMLAEGCRGTAVYNHLGRWESPSCRRCACSVLPKAADSIIQSIAAGSDCKTVRLFLRCSDRSVLLRYRQVNSKVGGVFIQAGTFIWQNTV